MPELVVEIGTEELPASFGPPARRQLAELVAASLTEWGISGEVTVYGTPRRLLLVVTGLPERQPDREEVVTGPPWERAFAADGSPTRAAEGFARKQGVTPAELEPVETPRGRFAGLRRRIEGAATRALVAGELPRWVAALRFPKTMRWEASGYRFARPLRWLVALWDGADLYAGHERPRLGDVEPGPNSRGHRFLGTTFRAEGLDGTAFLAALREQGVLVDPEERRRRIREAGEALAAAEGLTVAWDPELLDEVVELVEWPGVLLGRFDPAYLELPEAVLTASMQGHQRYFPLRGADGRMAPAFLVVINRPDDPEGLIRVGNERVLAARLADARFFWEQDLTVPLVEHARALERITWIEGLGTLAQLVARVERLAERLAAAPPLAAAGCDTGVVARAAALYLADLGTQMVYEFPEVQGEIGAIYARHSGEPEPVAVAIADAHRPRGADDELPASAEGALLAVAHRIDLVVGNLLAGHRPRGNQDPYGMRRAALGIFRILADRGWDLDLEAATAWSLETYVAQADLSPKVPVAEVPAAAAAFWGQRLEAWLAGEAPLDRVRAALGATGLRPVAAQRRLRALARYLDGHPHAEALLDTYKRLRNIARDAEPLDLDASLPDLEEERFAAAVRGVAEAIAAALERGTDHEAFLAAEALVPAAERLFEAVRINDPDPEVQARRRGLVAAARVVLGRLADFDALLGGGR